MRYEHIAAANHEVIDIYRSRASQSSWLLHSESNAVICKSDYMRSLVTLILRIRNRCISVRDITRLELTNHISRISANSNLHRTKDKKNDEFYTQLLDIKEQEWNNLVERAVVKTESLDFEFKNGVRIKITI